MQIEGARTNPTSARCRIAESFGVSIGRLLESEPEPVVKIVGADEPPVLWRGGAGGGPGLLRGVNDPAFVEETWQWRMPPGESHESGDHATGTRELIHLEQGSIVVTVDGTEHAVGEGETIDFRADRPRLPQRGCRGGGPHDGGRDARGRTRPAGARPSRPRPAPARPRRPRRRTPAAPAAPNVDRRRPASRPRRTSRCASTAAATSSTASTTSGIRSETSRPASRRACCTTRTTSRARPSAASSGRHRGVEHDHALAAGQRRRRRVGVGARPARSSYSPSCSATPPATTRPSAERPVARLDRPDHLLHVPAEARPERARAPRVSTGSQCAGHVVGEARPP